MSDTISYSKYPTDGQLTYNGGNFMTSNQASTVGCAGTSCKTLAANSVFTDPIEQGRTLAPATNTATNYNPSCGLSGGAKKRRSRRRRSSRKMKGGSRQLLNPHEFTPPTPTPPPPSGGSSKKRRSRRRRSSRKSMRRVKRGRRSTKKHVKKSHRVRHSRKHRRRTMKGGSKNQNQQLMSNICHSAGYSIGPLDTTIKPADVGLAAGHFAPYTKTQNN